LGEVVLVGEGDIQNIIFWILIDSIAFGTLIGLANGEGCISVGLISLRSWASRCVPVLTVLMVGVCIASGVVKCGSVGSILPWEGGTTFVVDLVQIIEGFAAVSPDGLIEGAVDGREGGFTATLQIESRSTRLRRGGGEHSSRKEMVAVLSEVENN
jgi:hypothetical protein